ncbi:Coenzyme PQQ synthesis protein D [Mammaliicoccus sciuri]|uniref:PqqD family protein n=1 Tax=Bacteria TaxID=2 RepID=UPI001EF6111A|nr:PqqD family protein [Mammaliicoccus sciuri]CAG7915101.1 Coenzyme PQQ synthesis protein D [Mammaliicoccus sciuri]
MILKRNLFVKYRTLKGEPYLLNGRNAFKLDEVGKVIWESIDGEKDLNEITEIVAKKFNIYFKDIEKDIKEFIEELKKNELISS